MSQKINIKGMNKAEVLMKLYNASQPLGVGILHFKNEDMTLDEAQAILNSSPGVSNPFYFDYLYGRVMKVDLSGDWLDPWGYDRDNGQDSARLAIEGRFK